MPESLISVILPVWKTKPSFVSESIRSILEQTFTNLELLVIYEKSSEIIDKEIENVFDENSDDHRLKVIHSKKPGFIESLNMGIDQASGEFLARMDGDDISEKNRFREQIDYLHQTQSHLVGSWAHSISDNGTVLGQIQLPVSSNEIRKKIMFHNPLIHPSIFFYRSLIKKIGNYNPLYSGAEDYDLYFRAIATHHKIANVPKTLLRLRETENSITRGTQWRKNKLMTWKVKKNAFKNLGLNKPRDFFYLSMTPLTLLLPPKIHFIFRNLWA